ncbi:MAG: rho GTPase-activating protein [Trizodia sp. TS-e1964]|nr:MAG: rho GTPase-activating protein [Trizodia sp. TS-e1964]
MASQPPPGKEHSRPKGTAFQRSLTKSFSMLKPSKPDEGTTSSDRLRNISSPLAKKPSFFGGSRGPSGSNGLPVDSPPLLPGPSSEEAFDAGALGRPVPLKSLVRKFSDSVHDLRIMNRTHHPELRNRPSFYNSAGSKSMSNLSQALHDSSDDDVPDEVLVHRDFINLSHIHIKLAAAADEWKAPALHVVAIEKGSIRFFKAPSSVHAKTLEIKPKLILPLRPSTAPSPTKPKAVPNIRHMKNSLHPELDTDEHGQVVSGTVEAICHHMIFSKDSYFAQLAVRTMPAWAVPATVLIMLSDLSPISDCASRVEDILDILLDKSPGLFLDATFYHHASLLIKKVVSRSLDSSAERLHHKMREVVKHFNDLFPLDSDDYKERPGLIDLSSTNFMSIEGLKFAQQVHLFHLSYQKLWSPTKDMSLFLISPAAPPPITVHPLVFSDSKIHFLTLRVLSHILEGKMATSAERRATVLKRWIKVGEFLRERGDMVGWLAIAMAVLSTSVLRLEETWKLIPARAIDDFLPPWKALLEAVLRRKFFTDSSSPHVAPVAFKPHEEERERDRSADIPYLGDFTHSMNKAFTERGAKVRIDLIFTGFEEIDHTIGGHHRKYYASSNHLGYSPDESLQKVFRALNELNQDPIPLNAPRFFQLSLECEPAQVGGYHKLHYTQSHPPAEKGGHVPLSFTPTMPSFALFDGAYSDSKGSKPHQQSASPFSKGSLADQAMKSRLTIHDNSYGLRRVHSFPPDEYVPITGNKRLDATTREHAENIEVSSNQLAQVIHDITNVGYKIYSTRDEELLLKGLVSKAGIRPSSLIEEDPRRQHPKNAALDETLVSAPARSRSTSPLKYTQPMSPKRAPKNKIIDVVLKAGSLERLVDLLLIGVYEFSGSIANGKVTEKHHHHPSSLRSLNMDIGVYRQTFFASYRSFCSPAILIESLRKRLIGAKWAALPIDVEDEDAIFPDWTAAGHEVDPDLVDNIDWLLVAKIHMGLLAVLHLWAKEWFSDFVGNPTLKEQFASLLVSAKSLVMKDWNKSVCTKSSDLYLHGKAIRGWLTSLERLFRAKLFSPAVGPVPMLPGQGRLPSIPSIARGSEIIVLSKYLVNLNAMAVHCFNRISRSDWMAAFELLEIQGTSPLGFFPPEPIKLNKDEDFVIQDVISVLGHAKERGSNRPIYDFLPSAIKDLVKLHEDLRSYLISEISDTRLGRETRQDRIWKLLVCLGISRQAMSSWDIYDNSESGPGKSLPSFVASAIASALVSPESRAYSTAWLEATKDVRTKNQLSSIQTLEQIVPAITLQDKLTAFAPSVSWVFERMLEIVCYVPNMLSTNSRLINFDKRRYAFNLVENVAQVPDVTLYGEPSRDNLPFTIPVLMQPDWMKIHFTAEREYRNSSIGKTKVFSSLLDVEREKIRRDQYHQELIARNMREQESRRYQHRRQLTVAGVGGAEVGDNNKRSRNKRIGSTFMRPFSAAFPSKSGPERGSVGSIPAAELPGLSDSGELRMLNTISIAECRSIAAPPPKANQYMIYMLLKDSPIMYQIQAKDEVSYERYVAELSQIWGRALTDGRELEAMWPRNPQPIMRVPLADLQMRYGTSVPPEINALWMEVERRGMVEGILRATGAMTKMSQLESILDNGRPVDFGDEEQWPDTHVLDAIAKRWVARIPDKLIPDKVLEMCQKAAVSEGLYTDEEKEILIRDLLKRLDRPYYDLLKWWFCNLRRVLDHESTTLMGLKAIATCSSINLSGPEDAYGSTNLGLKSFLIEHARSIFGGEVAGSPGLSH